MRQVLSARALPPDPTFSGMALSCQRAGFVHRNTSMAMGYVLSSLGELIPANAPHVLWFVEQHRGYQLEKFPSTDLGHFTTFDLRPTSFNFDYEAVPQLDSSGSEGRTGGERGIGVRSSNQSAKSTFVQHRPTLWEQGWWMASPSVRCILVLLESQPVIHCVFTSGVQHKGDECFEQCDASITARTF